MPQLGLGVWQMSDTETEAAVGAALDAGYRLVDTAAAYRNEEAVGRALRTSGVSRDEVFVTTKLWLDDYGADAARRACAASLARLGLDRVDLFLVHWPVPAEGRAALEAYRVLEELHADGRASAVGVSNFSIEDLERLRVDGRTTPSVNQVELHPYFPQRELREYAWKRGIVVQAWSPIGGSSGSGGGAGMGRGATLLAEPVLAGIAERVGRSPAQVVLRWHVQRGVSVVPKSVRPERIAENLRIFDFTLSDTDLALVDGLDSGRRGGPDPAAVNFSTFRRG
ncbi:aldo/keto reductase [Pseudonocardia spinosispora]|uniref:aldo/keto reductase n=1 Tax=Pseudonocardia spinosispora TaxID=103441 RepID=UPI000688C7B7|nr:aldo/keto reductase [Pseudonocardia spinosispora]